MSEGEMQVSEMTKDKPVKVKHTRRYHMPANVLVRGITAKKKPKPKPAKKPQGSVSIVKYLKEELEKQDSHARSNAYMIAKALIKLAKDGHLGAATLVLERVDGKVVQAMELQADLIVRPINYALLGSKPSGLITNKAKSLDNASTE